MLVALAIAGVTLYNTQQKRDQAAATAPKPADTTHKAAPPPVTTPTPVESLPPAGRGSLVKPDTAPKQPVATAAAYDTLTLVRIARMIRTANMDSVERAFPNPVPQGTRATLDQIFKQFDVLNSVALTHGATQTGSKSEMPFEIRVTYAPRGTGIGTAVLLRYTAGFELRSGKWVLTSVQSR